MSTQALTQPTNIFITNGDIQEYLHTYCPSIAKTGNPIFTFISKLWKTIFSCCGCCERKIALLTSDKGIVRVPTSKAVSALKLSDACIRIGEKVSTVFAREIFFHKLLRQEGISGEDLERLANSNSGIQVESQASSSTSSLYMAYRLIPSESASGTALLLCKEFNKRGAAELAQKQRADEEIRVAAELAQRLKAEEEAKAAELAQKQKADEEARVAAELAQRLKAEEEAKAAELAQKQRADEEARVAAELAQRLRVEEEAQQARWKDEGRAFALDYKTTAPHRKEGRRAPTHQEDAQFLGRPLTKANLFTTFAFISKNAANLLRNHESSTYVRYLQSLDQESKMKLLGMAEAIATGHNTPALRLIHSL